MRRWAIPFIAAVVAVATISGVLSLGARPAHAEATLAGTRMIVHKSPTCSCCGAYIDALREHGVQVAVIDANDTAAVKTARGVPSYAWSCHTIDVAGYAVEGHVPIEALERLLVERPEVEGIALPGMPAGSPGMGGVKSGSFDVIAFDEGETRTFGRF